MNDRITLEDLSKDAELRRSLKALVSEARKKRWEAEWRNGARARICKDCGVERDLFNLNCERCRDRKRKVDREKIRRAEVKARRRAQFPRCPGIGGGSNRWKPRAGSCPKFARYEVSGVMYCKVHARIAKREGIDGGGDSVVRSDAEVAEPVPEYGKGRTRAARPRLRTRNLRSEASRST